MGSPVQSLLSDPQFQTLSPEGRRAAVRGVGGAEFGGLSDDGIDKFITGMQAPRPITDPSAFRARTPSIWERIGNAEVPGTGVTFEQAGKNANEMLRMVGTEATGLFGIPALAAAPVATTAAVGAGIAGGKAAKFGAAKLGVGETGQELAENVGNIAAGALGATGGAALSERVIEPRIEASRISKGTKLGKQGLGIPAPPEAAELASKTAPDEINSARNFDIATKDLAKIARETPITTKGSAASFQHARSVIDYANNLWETEHQAPIARNANLQVGFGPGGDPKVLVKAAHDAITPEALDAEKNPASARRSAERWITQALDKPRSLSSLDQYIRELNADLDSPRAKQAYGPIEIRMKNAVVKAARGEVERLLTNAGETGVKDVNSRYGALMDIADHAIDQGLAEAKTERTANPLLDWAHSYVFEHRTGITGGIGINPAKLLAPSPSKMLTKGMGKLGRTSLEPPPPSPSPNIPVPPGNVPFGPPRPPNYQPPTGQATPVGPPPPPAGFPPTEPVARGPQWEPTPRSSQAAANLWNLSPDVTRPGGRGGLPPTVAVATGRVGAEFRRLGLTDLITPRQADTLDTMMRGPRWKDFDRNERLDAVRAVLHPAEDEESMIRRRPTGTLPEPPSSSSGGEKEGVPLDREERQRRYRRMTGQRRKGE